MKLETQETTESYQAMANSMIEKPKGREVVCHASAWDLCTGNDFRYVYSKVHLVWKKLKK